MSVRPITTPRGLVAALVAGLVALVAPASAGAEPKLPPAPIDSFYRVDAARLPEVSGDVVSTRRIELPHFPGAETHQVSFASTDTHGNPILGTTTLLLPPGRTPNGPLLSYQHIINALGPECAPSRALVRGDIETGMHELAAVNIALAKGWAVVIPDHLGPNSAYTAGYLSGHVVLDGIRAVKRVPGFGLAESPVGLAGYSGGGLSSGWAAALAPTYAPELDIVGSAQGGVPTDITAMARGLGNDLHPAFGLAFAAALGLEREYPDRLDVSGRLGAEGRELRDRMYTSCTSRLLAYGAGYSVRRVAPGVDLFNEHEAMQVLRENSLEFAPETPKTPIYMWHSATDPLVPYDSVVRTVGRYCSAGTPVSFRTAVSPEHLVAAAEGIVPGMEFLDARFAGRPAPSTC